MENWRQKIKIGDYFGSNIFGARATPVFQQNFSTLECHLIGENECLNALCIFVFKFDNRGIHYCCNIGFKFTYAFCHNGLWVQCLSVEKKALAISLYLRLIEVSAFSLRLIEVSALSLKLIEVSALSLRLIEVSALSLRLIEVSALSLRLIEVSALSEYFGFLK